MNCIKIQLAALNLCSLYREGKFPYANMARAIQNFTLNRETKSDETTIIGFGKVWSLFAVDFGFLCQALAAQGHQREQGLCLQICILLLLTLSVYWVIHFCVIHLI